MILLTYKSVAHPAVSPLGRSVGARGYSWRMDTREAAQRWAQVWERGWREHDATAIAALYAEDAFWQQHPFREPEPGYLARVFAEEESAQCQFGTPIVERRSGCRALECADKAKGWRYRESGGSLSVAFQGRRACGRRARLHPRLIHTPRRRVILQALPLCGYLCLP